LQCLAVVATRKITAAHFNSLCFTVTVKGVVSAIIIIILLTRFVERQAVVSQLLLF